MRIIATDNLRAGMRLGKNIHGAHGELYLRKNTVLTGEYIKRLKTLGYNGVFIEDAISEGIDFTGVVDETVRCEAVQKVKNLYQHPGGIHKRQWGELEGLMCDVVDQMMKKQTLVNNIVDLKQFDDYTFFHSVNVAFLSIATGIGMRLRKDRIHELSMSAIMHDVGKVYVPLQILNKPGKLTEEEFAVMKTHPVKGHESVTESGYLSAEACEGVLWHHERYDGRGYPDGKKGEEITLFGRIIAVCDVYDALTSDRPYRKAWDPYEAVEYIMGNGAVQFDPDILRDFLKRIAPYPVGTVVLLSDKRTGIIVENNPELVARPRIRVFKEEGQEVEPYMVDLSGDRNALNVTVMQSVSM